ncbi:MAG: NACHT domain-containing protein [Sedimentisphaerales bacterium]
MEDHDAKLKKIRGLTDEVRQLHPLLKDLLPKLPHVIHVEYTHGQSEMGADFIVILQNPTLGLEQYIGVIVKSGDIRQDHESLERQIKECSVKRKISGGKKEIYLNEIWVISNGAISANAKDKIYEEYHSKNITFIWDEILVSWIENYFKEYWEDMDQNVALYLSAVGRNANDLNTRFGLLDISQGDFYIEQDIIKVDKRKESKFLLKPTQKNTHLASALEKERFVYIQGGMGFGKSRLLRQAALTYANHRHFNEKGILPVFINYRDLIETHNNSLESLLRTLKTGSKIDPEKYALLFVIDAIDEIKGDTESKIEMVIQFISELMPHKNMKAVFASRPFEDPILLEKLDHYCSRYSLLPLSMQRMISFVEKLCEKSVITSRLKMDLQKSDLFRSLPRTPISAILLGRILNTDVKELPSSLPELYGKYLDWALGRWDIAKGAMSEKEYETTVILVRLIAKFMFENDLNEIGLGDVKGIIEDYIDRRETGQQLQKLFHNVIERSEIFLIDELQNKLFFKHRSFMEYMYAEEMFLKHGKSAKIEKPFDLDWVAVNYFYLGKLKDCPDRLKEIFEIIPANQSVALSKIMHSGQYLLAAYQSPYSVIIDCVKSAVLDAAKLYCDACENPTTSKLGALPELQLLAILTGVMRYTFEYDFFKHALTDIETEILLNVDSDKCSIVAAFFIAAIRGGLGHKDAFKVLVTDYSASLPAIVKLGIAHAADDANITNDAIQKLEKKLNRAKKENSAFYKSLYSTPMTERKDLNTKKN